MKIGSRFSTDISLPYNWEVVKVFEGEAKEMSTLEKKLHKLNKDFVYLPKIKFNGINECFKHINYELHKCK